MHEWLHFPDFRDASRCYLPGRLSRCHSWCVNWLVSHVWSIFSCDDDTRRLLPSSHAWNYQGARELVQQWLKTWNNLAQLSPWQGLSNCQWEGPLLVPSDGAFSDQGWPPRASVVGVVATISGEARETKRCRWVAHHMGCAGPANPWNMLAKQ